MKYVSVGKILNFHGIQGEAKVGYSKNQQDFFCGLKEVFIKTEDGYTPFKIARIRTAKNYAIVKFAGIDSIEDLIPHKGTILFVDENLIRESLAEDEFLIDELVGMDVVDEAGTKLGFVIGVSNNGVNDLLSVKTSSKKISLVPFVKEIVTRVDIKEKAVQINNLEGLLE